MNKENKKKGIIIFIIILILIIIGVIVYVKFFKNNKPIEQENNDSNNQIDESIIMTIEDAFKSSETGDVTITGKLNDTLNVGDTIKIIGENDEAIITTVKYIQMFRRKVITALEGDNIGIALDNVEKSKLKRGQKIIKIASNDLSNFSVNTDDNSNKEKVVVMEIEDAFKSSETGDVTITGKTLSSLNMGDTIQIVVGNDEVITTKVKYIMMFRRKIETALAGDNVSIALDNIEKSKLKRGQKILK